MAWRTVIIGSDCRVSLHRSQMSVERESDTVTIPVEDIAICVLENRGIQVTTALLSALADAGAAVAICDTRHMPNGILLPLLPHSRQSLIASEQIAWSRPFRKRAWQTIVQAKIRNQAHLLGRRDPVTARALAAMVRQVESGDPKNREAQAARAYWSALMPDGFIRGGPDLPNSLLNYGYTIMRSCVARALVGSGLLPCFGLHHDNNLNAFNLADDLIEPYRPFVDEQVINMITGRQLSDGLNRDDRAGLGELPGHQVLIDGELQTILNATRLSAESLVRAIRAKSAAELVLPEFMV